MPTDGDEIAAFDDVQSSAAAQETARRERKKLLKARLAGFERQRREAELLSAALEGATRHSKEARPASAGMGQLSRLRPQNPAIREIVQSRTADGVVATADQDEAVAAAYCSRHVAGAPAAHTWDGTGRWGRNCYGPPTSSMRTNVEVDHAEDEGRRRGFECKDRWGCKATGLPWRPCGTPNRLAPEERRKDVNSSPRVTPTKPNVLRVSPRAEYGPAAPSSSHSRQRPRSGCSSSGRPLSSLASGAALKGSRPEILRSPELHRPAQQHAEHPSYGNSGCSTATGTRPEANGLSPAGWDCGVQKPCVVPRSRPWR
eukprot:gnl/TRDRNA2_/TRDRNA2_80827_c0_seq1.p1 gnl/TRDRNA2_/TRDRNA2_80827_c0~~gnl/TRDRNA2_/TRDRNA2_80827_c0_seq1.p1  ORF type:complete len:315 (-),score=32.09 gnl/TRDRNA2_/TRDRNA2_80827_c0_seq1:118-1062(-)